MHVTWRQLRLVQALAETGSVSGAARALHVTQPTASMQLREVAQAVGLPLYEVIGKKLYLTEVGRQLAETARTMGQAWEAFEQGVHATRGLTRGKLRVAVVSTAACFVPRMIGSFCRRHPSIELALEILNRDGVVQRLRDNRDDLYIMSMPPPDMELGDDIFMPNPLVLIAAADDPLAGQAAVPLSALRARRFILREPGSGTRMAADGHFRAQQLRPDVRLELGSNEAITEAVAGGLGLGVVSRHALPADPRERGVAIVDVAGFPIASQWHVVHPRGKQLSPIATAFKAHLRAETGQAPA